MKKKFSHIKKKMNIILFNGLCKNLCLKYGYNERNYYVFH